RQEIKHGLPHRVKQQRGHRRHVGQPQRIEVMGQGEDHMVMVTSQQPGLLVGQPMLSLEIGALWTGPVSTGVVPDACHMAVGTRLYMTAQYGRPALHTGARGSADVAGERMGLLVGGERVLADGLQGNAGTRDLGPREMSKVGGVSLE